MIAIYLLLSDCHKYGWWKEIGWWMIYPKSPTNHLLSARCKVELALKVIEEVEAERIPLLLVKREGETMELGTSKWIELMEESQLEEQEEEVPLKVRKKNQDSMAVGMVVRGEKLE